MPVLRVIWYWNTGNAAKEGIQRKKGHARSEQGRSFALTVGAMMDEDTCSSGSRVETTGPDDIAAAAMWRTGPPATHREAEARRSIPRLKDDAEERKRSSVPVQ